MGWLLVRRYQNASAALKIYEATRDVLFTQDLDASVLRFTLDGVNHVAVLGEEPLDVEASGTVAALLDDGGEHAELPEPVRDELLVRRRAFKASGADFFERRIRPSTSEQTPPT